MSHNDELVINSDVVTKLLRCLSSDRCDDYNDWIQVCILIKNNYPELWEEFDSWSKGSSSYNYKQNKKYWDGIRQKQSGGLTIGSLMHWAKEDNRKEYNKIIQYMKEKEVCDAKDDLDEWYNKTRFQVHKTWFKLNHPLKYCRYFNGEIQVYDASEAKEFFKPKNLVQTIKGKEKIHYFFDMWSKDEFIKTYEGIVFDPQNKNPDYFNTFTGFDMDDNSEPKCIEEFDSLIKHVFKTDENTNYFYSWLNHIITKPHIKTGIAIILYSDVHGVGKNTIVELIMKLLGSRYCSKLNRIEDITSNFNSHLTQKLFIYGDEIRSRASDLASELKNVITQTEVLHTKKFMDSIKMKDLSNYFFTTNEEVAFKIELHDRRFFCVEVNGKKEKSFYKNFYCALEDEEKIKKFFSYVYNYKNIVDLKSIPETEYSKKLKVFSMNAVDHYLFNKLKYYQKNKINVKSFYDVIINHAKENRLPSNISLSYVNKIIDKISEIVIENQSVIKKRDRENTKYIFPKYEIMAQILKVYNASYYEHCGIEYESHESDDDLDKINEV